jgi:hypothetical protein
VLFANIGLESERSKNKFQGAVIAGHWQHPQDAHSFRRTRMAKGQLRSNKEAKKPKQVKTKGATPVSPFSASQKPGANTPGKKK